MKKLWIVLFAIVCSVAQTLDALTPQQQMMVGTLPPEQQKLLLEKMNGPVVPEVKPLKPNLLLDEVKDKDEQVLKKSYAETRKVESEELKFERLSQQIFSYSLPSTFSSTTNAVGADYPLKSGDVIKVSIWGGPEKEMTLNLNNKGAVFFENGGWVSLNGLTLAGAQQKITDVLRKSLVGIDLGNTQVDVRLEELSPIKVFILGEVKVPGGYVFHGNTNVLMALYQAFGPTDIGSVRKIQINRQGQKFEIDLYDFILKGERPSKSILADGDIVFLPKAEKLVKIAGEIGRPAIYELKQNEDFTQALAYAQGLKSSSARNGFKVYRTNEVGTKVLLDLGSPFDIKNLKIPTVDGDSVFVFETSEKLEKTVKIKGEVKYPGIYAWTEGKTLQNLLDDAGGLTRSALTSRIIVNRNYDDGKREIFAGSALDGSQISLSEYDDVLVFSEVALKIIDFVYIDGAVKEPLKMVWAPGLTIKDLILKAGGFKADFMPGKAIIERIAQGEKKVDIIEIEIDTLFTIGSANFELQSGDRVILPRNPNYHTQEIVSLEGAFLNPGKYSLISRSENLNHFMKRIGALAEGAYIEGAQFYRERAFREKKINPEDSTFIFEDVVELRQVNVDVASAIKGGKDGEILMQKGDKIFVPLQAISVSVEGEVLDPGEVLFVKGADVRHYLNGAGGFTLNSDEDRVIVIYANGTKSNMHDMVRPLDPGSKIVVGYKEADPPTDWLGGISAIVGIFGSLATIAMTAVTIVILSR